MGKPIPWRFGMNTSGFQRAGSISGDSPEDTAALREMAATAQKYLLSFHWCPTIKQIFLAYGVGHVVAVFLVQFAEKIDGKDEFLWVINGDIPFAYLVIDHAPSPSDALRIYCNLMEEWVDAVIGGKDLADVFAIDAKPTKRNAQSLRRRIQFLREKIIPIAKSQYHQAPP